MRWFDHLVAVIGGLAAVYAVLLLLLWHHARRHPGTVGLHDALKLLPEFAGFMGRLAADKGLPRRTHLALLFLLAYLVSPVDLVPDFIPLIGYADDVLLAAFALRMVVRTAGNQALLRNWRGSQTGLRLLERLAGLPDASAPLGKPPRADLKR